MSFQYRPTAPLDPVWARAVFDSIAAQWNRPRYRHERTDLTFTIRRDSALKTYHVLRASGNKDFDLLAARALALAAVGHKIPPMPANYLGDSVVFVMMFGDLDAYTDSLTAASDQQPALPWATNPPVTWPRGYRVTGGSVPVIAEFDVDSTGAVDLDTIKITSSPNDDFAAAVRTAIPTWHFWPALDHCRRVRSTYHFVQSFGS
jgi:outer membrane biosynthesis protein TonB